MLSASVGVGPEDGPKLNNNPKTFGKLSALEPQSKKDLFEEMKENGEE